MKKFLAIMIVFTFIIGNSAIAFADEGMASSSGAAQVPVAKKTVTTSKTGPAKADDVKAYRLNIGMKVERGVKNVLLGWTELPRRIIDISKETNNVWWGILAGTFQGAVKAMVKTASGAVDIITAPIDPEGKPFISPEVETAK